MLDERVHEIEGGIISFITLIHLASVRWDTGAQVRSLAAIPSYLSFTCEALHVSRWLPGTTYPAQLHLFNRSIKQALLPIQAKEL